jgi:hypothetical protein
MSEIERLASVAEAVAGESDEGFRYLPRAEARKVVRAVLHAMREPAQTQYDALCATDKMWREQTSEAVWKTYIDALLNEP